MSEREECQHHARIERADEQFFGRPDARPAFELSDKQTFSGSVGMPQKCQLLPFQTCIPARLQPPRRTPKSCSWTVTGSQFCERVKGTKRTRATARVVVLPGAIFSTTVRC